MELDGKRALVIAGSRGIGRAIATLLAERGADVVINYHENAQAAKDVAAAVEGLGRRAFPVQADMGTSADVERLFTQAQEALGGLDIVVNNVGINLVAPIAETDEADFDRTVAVNFKGSFLAMKYAARAVADGGRIINVSTGNTRVTMPWIGVYAGTKAAVEQMTFSLAKEIGSRKVTVNAVLPGLTDTDGLRPEIRAGADQIIAMTPLGRMGTPEDVAEVVAFLASDRAHWVTGQTIGASGGLA